MGGGGGSRGVSQDKSRKDGNNEDVQAEMDEIYVQSTNACKTFLKAKGCLKQFIRFFKADEPPKLPNLSN